MKNPRRKRTGYHYDTRVIARSDSDEAISVIAHTEIASLHFVSLAMIIR
jgi:hypothetical protein